MAGVALVGAGFLLGERAAARVSLRAGLMVFAIGVPAIAGSVILGERRWRADGPSTAGILAAHAGALPFVTVVIAARDEARALPDLLADIGRQDHREPDGRPCFDVIVIDDRSSDGTGAVARRAAEAAGIGEVTAIVRRAGAGLADGKGAALSAVPAESLAGDTVVVLDADARIEPGFLRAIASQMAGRRAALSCPISVARDGSTLHDAQAAEQRLDLSIQRARSALGGLSELRGNGMVIRRDVLVAAGGFQPALTEDLDLSSRLAMLGHRVGVARDVEIGADAVGSLRMLWAQRLRWSEGALRRVFEHGRSVLAARPLAPAAKVEFAIYAGHLALPGIVAGTALGALRHRRPTALAALLATWGTALLMVGRSGPAVLLSGLWLAAVPAAAIRMALHRGPVRYAKMEHAATGRETAARKSPAWQEAIRGSAR